MKYFIFFYISNLTEKIKYKILTHKKGLLLEEDLFFKLNYPPVRADNAQKSELPKQPRGLYDAIEILAVPQCPRKSDHY
jgi:hypothetical protein